MLYNIVVKPIEIIVDWVFTFFCAKLGGLGVIGAVCGVSLAINIMALPLYNIADSLQEKERKIAKGLEYRVGRIKKAFKGDEQFMMLSTYYRQNNYHPLYTLRSSLSILIEIPFFIAAYHYLSNCPKLVGVSFWIFKDLGAPDGLFKIGGFTLHVLPIIMTLINFVSGAIYTKDATLREKVQLYVVAVIFLVLLYTSPSGLVIYWILNNLFSLVKNIVKKTKHPAMFLHVSLSGLLLGASVFFLLHEGSLVVRLGLLLLSVCFCFLPLICSAIRKTKLYSQLDFAADKTDFSTLVFSAFGLALLCGFVLPSSLICTSPIEFSFLGNTPSPLIYVKNSFFIFVGLFVFWPVCIYKMFGNKVKKYETAVLFALLLTALCNAFIFKFPYSQLDISFELTDSSVLADCNLINLLLPFAVFALCFVLYFIISQRRKGALLSTLIFAICLAQIGIGIVKTNSIKKQFENYRTVVKTQTKDNLPIDSIYHLSRNQKNVVVLFLDRAVGAFLPSVLQDVPELKKQLEGFVYYPNALSFGTNTDTASPALLGGYEYTPEQINIRDGELLKDKHNEALMVMPQLFLDGGYDVTITDPPWVNYKWKGDLSIYEGIKDLRAYEIFGNYSQRFRNDIGIGLDVQNNKDEIVKKEIINFSVLQVLPHAFRNLFYKDFRQHFNDSSEYVDKVSCLYYLDKLCDYSASKGQFVFIDNETTHELSYVLDDFLTPCGKELSYKGQMKNASDTVVLQYSTVVASLKMLGRWFDTLRANGVYDNTRIIIVADHGWEQLDLSAYEGFENKEQIARHNILFMTKDFNSNGPLKTDYRLMTNADAIFFAKDGLGLSEFNPYTGKKFEVKKENGINVYPIFEDEGMTDGLMNRTQFTLVKDRAFHVEGDIFNPENWVPLLQWEKQTGGNK